MRLQLRNAMLVICGLVPTLSFAGQLPERFTLGRYVPGDVWLYLHGVHNPERAWLDKEWAEVFDALKASGIDRDFISMAVSVFGEEDQAKAEATIEKWINLFQGVRWGDLCGKEFVYAQRVRKTLGSPSVPYDYFFLTRGELASAEGNMAGLVAILKELASLTEKINLSNRELSGVTVWSMTFGGAAVEEFPSSIELFRKGDVIGLASGREPLKEVVGLMTGKSEKQAIVAAPRFTEALAQVKSPEDFLGFFDAKLFLRDLKGLMKMAFGHVKPDEDFERTKILSAIRKGIDLCDVMDYAIMTVETDGRRELTHEVARLQPAKQKSALASCFLERKPFQRFDQFLPADATGFNLTGLVNLEGLYKLVIDFIQNDLPNGTDYIAQWNEWLASVDFDPQRDLFSWWSGEMISVSLPPAVVTLMGGSDWVWMIRVKDGELASKKVNRAIDFASGKLAGQGKMLMVSPADVADAEGFREITHPMMMMFMRPVVGVKGEWLIIGSSATPINKCLDVDAGKAPSIVANERFQKEGLIPKGPVLSASFKDTSKFGQELAQAVGMAGMIGGMVSASLPSQDSDAKAAKRVLQKAMTAIMKLGPVLQKIDFYSSESSVTTYDGAATVRTEKVITYKSPPSKRRNVKRRGCDSGF